MELHLKKILFYFCIVATVTSCSLFKKNDKEGKDAIARAYEYYLYPEELQGLIPDGASKTDSINIIKNYIENWFRLKSVLHKAESNLDNEKKDVEKKLEEYRNSLLTYAYETELIKQKLDTIVGDEELANFYKNNQDNFELKDNIIKVIFFICCL